MTVKELYKWAKERDVLDSRIGLKFFDSDLDDIIYVDSVEPIIDVYPDEKLVTLDPGM